jgi:predicted RNase H-related nuclease YkuK (DUF458 family)
MKNTKFDYSVIKLEIEDSSLTTAIYVGVDSKCFTKKGIKYVAFATAIVLHYDQSRGAKLFKEITIERDYGSIRQRLMNEVYMAGACGMEIAESVGNDRPFEIHLDINPDIRYKSSMCVKEATGYILGTMGIRPKLKPDAFVASAVSDHYAVNTAEKHKQRR